MNHTFRIVDLFGSFLADGDLGNRFRFCEVEPILEKCVQVTFDFSGVTNMTDSFCNACFETLAEDHPDLVRQRVRFSNCTPIVKGFIANALSVGFQSGSRHAA